MDDRELMAAVEAIINSEADRLHGEAAADLRGELAELLPHLSALIDRAEAVAALRRAKGKPLSESNRVLLGKLHGQLARLAAMIESGVLG